MNNNMTQNNVNGYDFPFLLRPIRTHAMNINTVPLGRKSLTIHVLLSVIVIMLFVGVFY